MESMREQWTDERMDDLSHRVSDGFNRVDADLRSIRGEIGSLRTETNARFEHVDDRFDALQRTIVQIGGGMIATFVVGFVSLLVAHA